MKWVKRCGWAIAFAVFTLGAPALPARAHSEDGAITIDGCVGPRVQTVIQGDYRHGIPDRVVGDTPAIFGHPAGQEVGRLTAGTAYTVAQLARGYALLHGTKFSKPFAPGQTVGWVKSADVHFLALRNCN